MGPLGHGLSGLGAYYSICLISKRRPRFVETAGAVFLANLPDFDLIPALWLGFPRGNLLHHSYTHTFFFAIVVGLLAGIGFWIYSGRWRWGFVSTVFLLVALHVVGDYFTRDTGYPFGEMLWWPVSSKYYLGPTIFLDIHKGSWHDLFSLANLKATTHEFLIFTPILSWLTFLVYDRWRPADAQER